MRGQTAKFSLDLDVMHVTRSAGGDQNADARAVRADASQTHSRRDIDIGWEPLAGFSGAAFEDDRFRGKSIDINAMGLDVGCSSQPLGRFACGDGHRIDASGTGPLEAVQADDGS